MTKTIGLKPSIAYMLLIGVFCVFMTACGSDSDSGDGSDQSDSIEVVVDTMDGQSLQGEQVENTEAPEVSESHVAIQTEDPKEASPLPPCDDAQKAEMAMYRRDIDDYKKMIAGESDPGAKAGMTEALKEAEANLARLIKTYNCLED